ncbi:MAG: hypothetical protein MJ014_02300 [Methanocorpusculum sp.]|nr:hypothetical protein [Methanocorpusculum sp.]
MLTILLHAGFLAIEVLLMPRDLRLSSYCSWVLRRCSGCLLIWSRGFCLAGAGQISGTAAGGAASCVLLGIGICCEVAPNALTSSQQSVRQPANLKRDPKHLSSSPREIGADHPKGWQVGVKEYNHFKSKNTENIRRTT